MPRLLDLPSELISAIFEHFDNDADFFATRLTNSAVETACLTLFGRRFFRKKGYMLTSPSLDTLNHVANNFKLKKYVHHIWFNPDCYTFVTPACAPEEYIDCDDAENDSEDERIEVVQRVDLLSEEDRVKWEAYLEVMEDHEQLLNGDAAALESRLKATLPLLPNLKIIGMRRSEDHSPWGFRKLQSVVGDDPRVLGPIPRRPMPCLSDPTKLFKTLISAVASSGTRLQRLYTDAIEIDNMVASWLPRDTLQKALASLLYLEINVSKAVVPMTSSPHYRVLRDGSKYGDGLLKALHAAAPALLELGLQVFPELRKTHASFAAYGSDSWKLQSNQYLTFKKVVDNVRLEHLTRLKLEKIVAGSGSVTAFLTPSKDSLTSLKMRDIRLLDAEDGDRPWERIFDFLLTSVPNLDYFLFYQLLYTRGGVSFVERPPRPSSAILLNANTGDAENGDATSPQELVSAQDAGHLAYVYGDLHSPEARGGGGTFREYEHITLEASGRDDVVRKLEKVRTEHWYCGNLYSYAMDEAEWHTDTSDEEW